MISIDKLVVGKANVSTLFVFVRNKGDVVSSKLIDSAKLNFVNRQWQENGRDFFPFNCISHWVLIAIVEKEKDSYFQMEMLRRLGGRVLDFCDREYIKDLQFVGELDKECALSYVEGMLLASYTFDNYKTDPKKVIHPFDHLDVINEHVETEDLQRLLIVARAVEKCKDLVNEPYCSLNAEGLAAAFVNMSHEVGIDVEVMHKQQIETKQMGGILAVNKGSVDPPTFTVMQYSPENAVNDKPLVLVGKGLVYDTGGLNLKPGDYMNDMKEDMAGAAVMACAMYAVAALGLPVKIVGLFPSTDNRPGGDAYASGDIVNMYDGTNVEVVNTDAEGRMILADALAYAKEFSPALVVDAATLTGAASRAIGPYGIACVEKDAEKYMDCLCGCGEKVYERIARFPFWREYDQLIKSDIADIKNCGPAEAGMITAGKFLAYFTDYPFIHLDIAGVAMFDKKKDYTGKGATGFGVRLIVEFADAFIAICKHDKYLGKKI